MIEHKISAVVGFSVFSATAKKSKQVLVKGRGFYSLSYRHKGKTLIKNEETEFISEAGSVTFVPKGVAYATEILEDGYMTVIHFKLASDIDFRNPEVISIEGTKIPFLFDKLEQSYRIDDPMDLNCFSMLYELFASLENLASHKHKAQIPDKIRMTREYIQQNYSDPYFSVASVAENFDISTSYLRREFSLAYGESPIAFLGALRLGKAKTMLTSEYLTVAEIAEQCGYTSSSYFIQVFRKATGESPNRYRRRINSIVP